MWSSRRHSSTRWRKPSRKSTCASHRELTTSSRRCRARHARRCSTSTVPTEASGVCGAPRGGCVNVATISPCCRTSPLAAACWRSSRAFRAASALRVPRVRPSTRNESHTRPALTFPARPRWRVPPAPNQGRCGWSRAPNGCARPTSDWEARHPSPASASARNGRRRSGRRSTSPTSPTASPSAGCCLSCSAVPATRCSRRQCRRAPERAASTPLEMR